MSVLKKEGYTSGHFGKWQLGTLSKEKGNSAKLYDIPEDSAVKVDLSKAEPETHSRMKAELLDWKAGVMEELKSVE